MAQIKVTNVQYPMVFNVELGPDDIGNEVVIDVPPGFILTGGAVAVRQNFNGTTPTVTVTDNKQVPTAYVPSTALTTAAAEALSFAAGELYAEYPNGGKISIRPVIVSGSTTIGRADVIVSGIVRGRQNERVGANVAT